jgi:hypothetical protein
MGGRSKARLGQELRTHPWRRLGPHLLSEGKVPNLLCFNAFPPLFFKLSELGVFRA